LIREGVIGEKQALQLLSITVIGAGGTASIRKW
jgi:hypothetical protein